MNNEQNFNNNTSSIPTNTNDVNNINNFSQPTDYINNVVNEAESIPTNNLDNNVFVNQNSNSLNIDNSQNMNLNQNVAPVESQIQPNVQTVEQIGQTQTNSTFQSFEQPIQSQQIAESAVNNPTSRDKKINKKIILGIAIIIAVLIIGAALFIVFGNKNGVDKEEMVSLNIIFDPDRPIVIEENDKYGYITADGKMMIEPQFHSADNFYGDYAIVSVDNTNKDTYNEYMYQVIDKKGNVKFSSEGYTKPEYYQEYEIWVIDNTMYDSKFNKKLEEGVFVKGLSNGYFEYIDYAKEESGIINYKGKKIFTWEGISISVDLSTNKYDNEDLFAIVKNYDDREVIISLKTGKILYTLDDPENYNITDDSNGLYHVYDTSNYETNTWLYFYDGKLLYEYNDKISDMEIYDYEKGILELNYGYNYVDSGKTGQYQYYDTKNKKLLNDKPSSSNSSSTESSLEEIIYGYKKYRCSSKYGLIANEEVVLSCEYDAINFINSSLFTYMKGKKGQELVLLQKDKQTILMDLKDKENLVTFDSTSIQTDNSTFIKVYLYEDNSYNRTGTYVYNVLNGKSISFSKEETVNLYSNYITVIKDNKKDYYNTKLDKIYSE